MGYRLLPFCTASSSLTSCIGSLSNAAQLAAESDNMLFSLVYEKKPLQVKADYKYVNVSVFVLNHNGISAWSIWLYVSAPSLKKL